MEKTEWYNVQAMNKKGVWNTWARNADGIRGWRSVNKNGVLFLEREAKIFASNAFDYGEIFGARVILEIKEEKRDER